MKRKDHWEHVYKNKSPLEVSWYQREPTLSLKLIENAEVDKSQPIIDVGGGASTLVDHLIDEGYEKIAVLDISERALHASRDRLGKKGLRVLWHESDITSFRPPSKYVLWHDRAVFHFLTDPKDRFLYVSNLKKALAPGGQVIIAAFAIGGPTQCSGLDIVQYDVKKLQHELGEDFHLVEQEEEIHRTPAGGDQHFVFFRFIRH